MEVEDPSFTLGSEVIDFKSEKKILEVDLEPPEGASFRHLYI